MNKNKIKREKGKKKKETGAVFLSVKLCVTKKNTKRTEASVS